MVADPAADDLERAYLAGPDPRAQSGFRGSPQRWERLRRPILDAVDRSGGFLDVGCANGHLLASLVDWAAADGWELDPYGVDVSAALIALARRRLPRWRDRLEVGDIATWTPPRRFDFVRTELVYAPPALQPALVDHLLRRVVAPGGRLIVCAYASRGEVAERPLADPSALLAAWGHRVSGGSAGRDPDGTTLTRVAWIDAPQAAGSAS